ncbi:MAG: hypothetical protein NC078_09595 [Ruminococcus sp.]|nr:hypothetical protein [Ruminococcus sp.]
MSKVRLYPSALLEDIFLCGGLTYAAACFNADSYISGGIFTAAKTAAALLAILCHWYFSLMNGLRHRKGFLLFTVLFLGVIPAAGFGANNLRAFKFTLAGLFARELSNILSVYPYSVLSAQLPLNTLYIQAAVFIISFLLFWAGYLYTNKAILNR